MVGIVNLLRNKEVCQAKKQPLRSLQDRHVTNVEVYSIKKYQDIGLSRLKGKINVDDFMQSFFPYIEMMYTSTAYDVKRGIYVNQYYTYDLLIIESMLEGLVKEIHYVGMDNDITMEVEEQLKGKKGYTLKRTDKGFSIYSVKGG